LKEGEFISDIYNDEILDPHDEFRAGYRMLHNDPDVASAIGTRVDMLMGRELTVESDDDETQEYFENEVLPKIKQPLRNALRDMSITGNGYIEVMRGNQTGVPLEFEEVQRPHKVYIDFNEQFEVEKYVIKTRGTQEGKRYDVSYFDGRTKTVKGVAVDPDNLVHLREGSGSIPKYGRSDFLSAVDSYKMKREMMRSQAVIARQKSIPRKLVKVKGIGGDDAVELPDDGTNQSQKAEIEGKLSNMSDYENPVIYDTEVEVEDFDYDPSVGENQEVIKELSREITASMPDYLTRADNSNKATAAEEKKTLQLRMSAVRDSVSSRINSVLQEIAEENGYDTDVTISFGDFDWPTRKEKVDEATTLYQNGVISQGEARNMLDFEDVDGDAKFVNGEE